ncbi:membrane-bound lytic murein transglycosylase A [Legionella antarctica]|uniref:Membrane-bound lytic murein transglycosylase A n=1 Tax=Legionella antarctica TaxID=2708020 RepID=A0A6F8T6G2_9GAMM|nr:MltA domain-containing protein [Legionella antarctica]BCA96274.1 membrane-bound lytic murein transglycosylase A [Legionella antarctica]
MNSKYIIIGIIYLTFRFLVLVHHEKAPEITVPPKKEVTQTLVPLKEEATKTQSLKKPTTQKDTSAKVKLKKVTANKETSYKRSSTSHKHKEKMIINNSASDKLSLIKVSFDELPGWDKADVKKSLLAFQLSCDAFLKQKPSHSTGSTLIKLKAGDWHPACKAAVALDSISEDTARTFFEKWFHPLEFEQKKPVHGLFTGYYMPRLEGSLKKTSKYNTPIYGLPKNSRQIHYTREQIDNGLLKRSAPVLAWIHSPVERLFLEIEGSGVIQLTNGKNIYLGYAGENGAPYTSIGKVLIDKGIMTKNNASKSAIIRYLESHTDIANNIIHKNKSFVFFEHLKRPVAVGAQDMTLTPGYSLAIDKKWIPLGAPLWLDTKRPSAQQSKEKQFQRLMIAQDTGGAIRGFMRGDIYWGSGKIAAFLGEHMKNKGHYWLLLPKHSFNRLAQ